MDGKRFGVGVAAGLLVGLALITVSSGLGSTVGGFGPAMDTFSHGGSPAVTTTVSTVSTAATVAQTSTTSNQTPVSPGGNTSSLSGNTTKSVSTTPNSVATQTNQVTFTSNGANAVPGLSSNIESLPRQPLFSNAIVFVPVLVAFLLGAVLYRASTRNREQPSEE